MGLCVTGQATSKFNRKGDFIIMEKNMSLASEIIREQQKEIIDLARMV